MLQFTIVFTMDYKSGLLCIEKYGRDNKFCPCGIRKSIFNSRQAMLSKTATPIVEVDAVYVYICVLSEKSLCDI